MHPRSSPSADEMHPARAPAASAPTERGRLFTIQAALWPGALIATLEQPARPGPAGSGSQATRRRPFDPGRSRPPGAAGAPWPARGSSDRVGSLPSRQLDDLTRARARGRQPRKGQAETGRMQQRAPILQRRAEADPLPSPAPPQPGANKRSRHASPTTFPHAGPTTGHLDSPDPPLAVQIGTSAEAETTKTQEAIPHPHPT